MAALAGFEPAVDSSTRATSGKVLRRRERTRERLLHVGAMKFVADGVENVTIDDIVEEADIARGTFYSLFDSKEHLINSIIHPVFEHATAALESLEASRPRDLLRGVLLIYAALWDQLPHALLLAFRISRKYFFLFQELHRLYEKILPILVFPKHAKHFNRAPAQQPATLECSRPQNSSLLKTLKYSCYLVGERVVELLK